MKPFILLFAFCCLPLVAHAQTPWRLEAFLEYFGHVRGSGLGSSVKGFVGSHSNNPYNVAVTEGRNQVIEDPRLLFYHLSTPQDTTPGWIIPYANRVNHGDFNSDDLTDLAVRKSVNTDRDDTILVYLGNPAGIDTIPAYKLPAEQERSAFGRRMCVGDLNNDGTDDLVITAREFYVQLGQLQQGKVYVYFGGDTIKVNPDFTITGGYAGARLGSHCAIADLNDDGYNDLAVRGSNSTVEEGFFEYLNIYFGSAAPFDTVADLTSPRSYRTIVSGLAAFDANADGKTDLLWAFLDSLTSKQSVFVHYGGVDFAERFQTGPDFIIPAPFGSGEFGNEIANAGDMNGDGDDDIVIAAYSTGQNNGIVFVYTAGKALDGQFDAARGQSREGLFGASVDRVGDINHDGYSDIIVGAPSQPWTKYQGYFGIFLGDRQIPTRVATRNAQPPPTAFAFGPVYPNPLALHTSINFTLPLPARVEMRVYNVLGKEVMTVLDGEYPAGQHELTWNGRSRDGQFVAAGVYFVRMRAFSAQRAQLLFEQSRKFAVVK